MKLTGVFRKSDSGVFEGNPWANIKVRDDDRSNPTDLVTVKPPFNEDGDADLQGFKNQVSGLVAGDRVEVLVTSDRYGALRLVAIAKVTGSAPKA